MSAHESHDRHRRGNAASDADGPEWATRAATAQVTEWSSDRHLDPGDTHDKGEPSLCVGEAA